MAKKLLAVLLSLTMLFTMCGAVGVFAEDSTETGSGAEVTPADEPTEEEGKADEPTDAFEGEPIEINISSSYKQGATVVIKGTVNDPAITLLNILIESEDDDVLERQRRIKVSEFEDGEITYSLKGASAGAVYTITVEDDDNSANFAEAEFAVTKSSTAVVDPDDGEGDGSGKVTIWIDGYHERYVDKQTIALDQLYDEPTVLSVAEYLLEEVVDRKYRLNTDGSKIDRIATTATGSTYLRDGSITNNTKAEWMYFLNGRNYPQSMAERTVKSGDEIVIYFGEPGVTGYPVVTVSPSGGLSLNDYLEVSVQQQITDPETYEITSQPLKSAKVYLFKRNATKYSTSYTTNSSGIYKSSSKISTSFISSYQGGSVRVAYFASSSTSKTAPYICSKDIDLVTDRTGYTQATISIEGAYNTLLEPYKPTSSAKIEEYDLYNYTIEVLDLNGVDIEYEVNSAKNNFTSFEANSSRYYSHENGDITKDSAWYVTVNGMVFGPDDNLKQVEVYTDDEIIYYFGNKDTRYVYYNIPEGTSLTSGATVKVYFYYDDEFTEPVSGLDVYFDGSGKSVKYKTDSDGMIKLAAVDYRGTYELQWGEHITTSDSYMPEYVYRAVDLTYTGTSKPSTSTSTTTTTRATTEPTERKTVDPDDWEEKETDAPFENTTKSTWEQGDLKDPQPANEGATQSKYYPDTNIDLWAVANIEKARDYGLMSGTAQGYFEPLRGITRAEFTTIITRIIGLNTEPDNYNQVFSDVKPSDWCFGQVMAAYSAGYVSGKDDTVFAPTDYITREEMAVLISRIIGVSGAGMDATGFKDYANISVWARDSVAAVNNVGLMKGDQFGQFLPRDYVNRETAATVAVRLYEYLGK